MAMVGAALLALVSPVVPGRWSAGLDAAASGDECAPEGVDTRFGLTSAPGLPIAVTSVMLRGMAAACAGAEVSVTLTGPDGRPLGRGTAAVVPGPELFVALDSPVAPAATEAVHVTVRRST